MNTRLWVGLALLLALGVLGCKKSEVATGAAGAGVVAGAGVGIAGVGATAGVGAQPIAGTGAAGTGATAGAGAAGSSTDPAPGTFGYLYRKVFVEVGCSGGTLCHATAAATSLSLANKDTAYMALVNMPAGGKNLMMGKGPDCKDSGLKRVVPGMPDQSLLMLKVEAKQPCGDPMPPTGTALAADKVQMIRDWIMNGAKND